jgi:hypothetical protein
VTDRALGKRVAPGHRQRLTLVETGDLALALTLAGLLATGVVLWRRWCS